MNGEYTHYLSGPRECKPLHEKTANVFKMITGKDLTVDILHNNTEAAVEGLSDALYVLQIEFFGERL